jgi:hypothetical protein
LINTLLVTIVVEGAVVIVYSVWRKKPIGPILFTSVCVNLTTQPFLWIILNLFFQYYRIALPATEILIGMIESVLMWCFPANRLHFADAVRLSLIMNLASFGVGWFLPV